MLDFCDCKTAQTHTVQLLCTRWYPAMVMDPWTAATFRVLNHFQMYTFESKGSAFEYYQALARLTDNTRRHQTKVSAMTIESFSMANMFIGSLWSFPPYELAISTHPISQMSWTWPWSWWCSWYSRRWTCCTVPSLSSTEEKLAIGMGDRGTQVSSLFWFRYPCSSHADGVTPYFLQWMPIFAYVAETSLLSRQTLA